MTLLPAIQWVMKPGLANLILISWIWTLVLQPARAQIPVAPTAPPALSRRIPSDAFRCQRQMIYKGKELPCDSHLHRDGEALRPIIQDVPGALDELNQYQRTRRTLQRAAYVGTFGLALLIGSGLFTSLFFTQEGGGISNDGQQVGRLMRWGGLGIAIGSTTYGLAVLRSNEQHLNNAAKLYNDVHPDNPIELKFSTGF